MNIQRITRYPNVCNNGRQIYRHLASCESFNDAHPRLTIYRPRVLNRSNWFSIMLPREKRRSRQFREIRFATSSSLAKFKIEVYVGIGEERR